MIKNTQNKQKKWLNFLNQSMNKLTFSQGALMWGLLISGYILFVVSWLLLGRLAGSGAGNPGWVTYFFGETNKPDAVTTQAINYTITFMRGVGSLLVGWLIVKITHKWSVVISLALVLMAIPAVYMPGGGIDGSIEGFVGFIIFRMLLAIGGTTLIIYIQPVLAKSMTIKQKGYFSIVSPFGFNIGTIIIVVPFIVMNPPVDLLPNWQWIAAAAAITAIPLILYIIFGKNFDTNTQQKLDNTDDKKLPSSPLKILKEKQTWVWVLVYGSWLVVAVIPITGLFRGFAGSIAPETINLNGIVTPSLGGIDITKAHNIFTALFVAGVFLAPFTIGRWNLSSAKRKPFVIFIGIMIILSFILIVIGAMIGSLGMFLAFGFIAGWFVWSIQGVILNNPHERKGNTPKRVGVLFSFIWGFGYWFYTIANIILAAFVPAGANTNLQIAMISVFFVMISIFPLSFMLVKETKPNRKLLPEFLNLKNIFNKKL